jgi:hypothetical protein
LNFYSKIFFVFLAGAFAYGEVSSQSLQPTVIASDGGSAVVPSGSISWTLGETVTETFSSPGNYLTQGFHQPAILLVSVSGASLNSGAGVYPNPTTDLLYINLNYLAGGNYTIIFYDVVGNKVKTLSAPGGGNATVQVKLADLANGVYMLSISGTDFSQSFKVIKTN